MGGGISLNTPVSPSTTELLGAQYKTLVDSGLDEAAISAKLAESLGGVIVFDQVDCDHSGKVTKKELKRILRSLHAPVASDAPKAEGPSLADVLQTLDADKEGFITLEEWLQNLGQLPLIQTQIDNALDKTTGKLAVYISLETRLADLLAKREAMAASAPKDAGLDHQIENLRLTVGSAGITVFRQVDTDHDGVISLQELVTVLKHLPKAKEAQGTSLSVEDIFHTLDIDGDGCINEDEWNTQLHNIPVLHGAIESCVDPHTGKILGFKTMEVQLWDLKTEIEAVEDRIKEGEDGPALAAQLEKKQAKAHQLIQQLKTDIIDLKAKIKGGENGPAVIAALEKKSVLQQKLIGFIDPYTGEIVGVHRRASVLQSFELDIEITALQEKIAGGEDGPAVQAELDKKQKRKALFDDRGVIPEAPKEVPEEAA